MHPGAGVTVLVVASEPRMAVKVFLVAHPERVAARAEDAVNQGESSLLNARGGGSMRLSYVASYYCIVVNGQRGCCKNGKICTSGGGSGCVTSGIYVRCAGENFCCRECSCPRFFPYAATSTNAHLGFSSLLQLLDTPATATVPVTLSAAST